MKPVLAVILLLFFTISVYALSVEEIARLSKLKTSDDLLIQIIQKDKPAKPLSSRDILFLKEQGVSDRVISYLIQTSGTKQKEDYIAENLRVVYTTDKKGKQHRVVTNMDEKGKRLGPELPPEAKQEVVQYQAPEPPREVYVILKDESDRRSDDYEDEYSEPPPDQNGIPLYDGYYPGYSPYFVPYYFPHNFRGSKHRNNLNQPDWRFKARPPKTRTSASRPPMTRHSASRASSAGTRTSASRPPMTRPSASRPSSAGTRTFQRP